MKIIASYHFRSDFAPNQSITNVSLKFGICFKEHWDCGQFLMKMKAFVITLTTASYDGFNQYEGPT